MSGSPGGPAITLNVGPNTQGNDTIGVEGIDFTSAGSGTQDLAIPLDTKGAKGQYQLIGVGGVAGLLPSATTLLKAAPGRGQANAGAISSGGGGVNVLGSEANVTDSPTVTTTVHSDTKLTANGDVTIGSISYVDASADGTDSGGGFVGVGESKATITSQNNNSAVIGDTDVINAKGCFELVAQSYATVNGSTDSRGGGFVKIGDATTTTNLGYNTLATVGQLGQITAGSTLSIESRSETNGVGNSTTRASGFGTGAHANDSLFIGSPKDNTNVATTLTTVQTAATLVAPDVVVNAVTKYNTVANSTAVASAFAAAVTANSTDSANETSHVAINPGAIIIGSRSVSIDALNTDISDVANATARCNAAFGSADSTATTNIFGPSHFLSQNPLYSTLLPLIPDMSQVDASQGATVKTPYLVTQSIAAFNAVQNNTNTGGGFIVSGP